MKTNRRTLLLASMAGLATGPAFGRVRAQEATPSADAAAWLLMLRWELQRIASGRRTAEPENPAAYWIQLLPDGTVFFQADCNRGRGRYTIDRSSIAFKDLISTKVACGPDSLFDQFLANLGYVVSYLRTGDLDDQLVLEMMADGGQMTFVPALTGVVWEWVEFQSGDGSLVMADDPSRYTIEFLPDDTVQVKADCNQGGGKATIDGASIDLTVATTLIACPEESQASEFLRYLDQAVSFVIRDGRLALSLPMDAGIAFFRPSVPLPPPATPEATPGG